VDFGGNQSNPLAMTVTVTAANLSPTGFSSWGNVSNATPSTLYTAANTWTVAGMSSGVNAPLSATGNIRVSTDGGITWTAWGSPPPSVQNGAKIQAQATSSSAYSTAVNNAVTVGTITVTFSVTTEPNPAQAGFTPSSNQAPQVNNNYSSSTWTFAAVDFLAGYPVIAVYPMNGNPSITSVVLVGAGSGGTNLTGTIELAGGSFVLATFPAVTAGSYVVQFTASAASNYGTVMCGTITNAANGQHPSATTSRASYGTTSGNAFSAASAITNASTGVGVCFCFYGGSGIVTETDSKGTILAPYDTYGRFISVDLNSGSWTPAYSVNSGAYAGLIAGVWS
jgi:hypothetical protein